MITGSLRVKKPSAVVASVAYAIVANVISESFLATFAIIVCAVNQPPRVKLLQVRVVLRILF